MGAVFFLPRTKLRCQEIYSSQSHLFINLLRFLLFLRKLEKRKKTKFQVESLAKLIRN